MKSDPVVVIVPMCDQDSHQLNVNVLQLCLSLCWNIREMVLYEQTRILKNGIRSVSLIYTAACICVLVRLLTKTFPPRTLRLQPKHFPKPQQRPGTVASVLLHSRARQPRSSVPSTSEVQQVQQEHRQPFLRLQTWSCDLSAVLWSADRGRTRSVKPLLCAFRVIFQVKANIIWNHSCAFHEFNEIVIVKIIYFILCKKALNNPVHPPSPHRLGKHFVKGASWDISHPDQQICMHARTDCGVTFPLKAL